MEPSSYRKKYSIRYFINPSNVVPGFVYPIFSNNPQGGAYVEDGKSAAIMEFIPIGDAAQGQYKVIPLDRSESLFATGFTNAITIGDPTIYAIEITENRVVYGGCPEIIQWIQNNYVDDANTDPLWLAELLEFCTRIQSNPRAGHRAAPKHKAGMGETRRVQFPQAFEEKGAVRLLMTQTDPGLSNLLQASLPLKDIHISTCQRNGAVAYNELQNQNPDAVLLDIFMPGMDAFTLKTKYDKNHPNSNTLFFAMGAFKNDEIEKEALESGFLYYFLKPFDVDQFAAKVLQSLDRPPHTAHLAGCGNDTVTDILRLIGIPAHIKGYRFLRESIYKVMDDPSLADSMPGLYVKISQANGTTASRVERAIRHAIEVAWDRGDFEALSFYMGNTTHPLRGKPSNSEFIAAIASRTSLLLRRPE